MATRTLAEATTAMDGTLRHGDPASHWSGIALDSRQVEPGALFFALPGEQTDGHQYVAAALSRGAAAAVVEVSRELDGLPADGPLIAVSSPYAALHALTRWVRATLPTQGLVGVTGSAGKTTTKELVAAVLATRQEVAKSPGNLNNLFGFPVALLGIPEGSAWMVAELGMSTPGELRGIAALARPEVVVYTSIKPVHLERFGTIHAIAEAKAELLEGLARGGTVIANADDLEVTRIVERHQRDRDPTVRVVWYATGQREVAVQAAGIRPSTDGLASHFVLRASAAAQLPGAPQGGEIAITLPLLGRHNVENALAAAATGLALGVDLENIARALGSARPAAMRGVVLHLANDVTLVDDSYNSNPAALGHALAATALIPARRHWAVLGDMRELGASAAEFHHAAGATAAELGFKPLLMVGHHANDLAAGAASRGTDATCFANAVAAAEPAAALLSAGDLVLVKGSRGVGLERVVNSLVAAGGGAH